MKNKKSVITLFKQFCCFDTVQQSGISNIKGKYPVLSKTIFCEDCSCDFAAKQTIFPSKAGKAKTGALRKPCRSPFKTMVRVRPPHFIKRFQKTRLWSEQFIFIVLLSKAQARNQQQNITQTVSSTTEHH